jgi:hypothetical protein
MKDVNWDLNLLFFTYVAIYNLTKYLYFYHHMQYNIIIIFVEFVELLRWIKKIPYPRI